MLTKEDEIIEEQDKQIKTLEMELSIAKTVLQKLKQEHAQLQHEYDMKKVEIKKRNYSSSIK